MLLNSCIEGDEELFIEADGKARVKAVYRVPGILLSAEDAAELQQNIATEVAEEEHLTLVTNRVDMVEGNRVIVLEIATGDLLSLEDVLSEHKPETVPSSKADKILHALIGRITVNLQGTSVGLQRDVNLKPLLDEYLGKRSAAILGDSEFRYTIHFPKAVSESNAHTVENGGRTLKWTYKLAECEQKPISLNMVAPIPLPWWVYVAVVLAVFLLGLMLYGLVRKLSRMRKVV